MSSPKVDASNDDLGAFSKGNSSGQSEGGQKNGVEITDLDEFENDFADQPAGRYTQKLVSTQNYHYKSGIIQLPVSDDAIDGSIASEMIQLECPTGLRVVNFIAEREGLAPDVPDALLDINDNEVLLEAVITVVNPPPLIMGTSYAYRVEGVYTYASKYPWRPTQSGDIRADDKSILGIPWGQLPVLKQPNYSLSGFPKKHFVTGFAEPATLSVDEEDFGDQDSTQTPPAGG